MNTPPPQPGSKTSDPPKLSIQKQLDELLVKIETAEPGTLDPEMLPQSFRNQTPPPSTKTKAPNKAAAKPAAPAPAATQSTTPEQADMLASLNLALQGLNSDPADKPAAVTDTPADETRDERSMEEKLQQEIAALMSAPPQAAAPKPTSEPAASDTQHDSADLDDMQGSFESPDNLGRAPGADQASQLTTEDQIAMEIQGLLGSDQNQPATSAKADTSIDELDALLANEIDADDDLAGDFHTVEDITSGIEVAMNPAFALVDEHAASARDVAAELDTQPEDLAKPLPHAVAPDADPFAVLESLAKTAEKNEREHRTRVAMQMPDWVRWSQRIREQLLNVCYVLNWPARRFLTTEWRANLGYIALLNLFFGVGLWFVLIFL